MTNHISVPIWIRKHALGLGLLIGLLILSSLAVRHFKRPGQMSVIEAQAMDMTAMKPPTGAVPVATEIVQRRGYNPTVHYTGSVAPLNEQNVASRVEGWIANVKVYNGDSVHAGQLLASIDSPDLQSRAAEAAYGHSAAVGEVSVSQQNLARMKADRSAAYGEIGAMQQDVIGAKARVNAAERSIQQVQKEVKSADASLAYWKAEIRREEALLKAGAVSRQEYESEKSQSIAAEAELENKQAKLEEARANADAMRAEAQNKQTQVKVARDRARSADAAFSAAGQEIRQKSALVGMAGAVHQTAALINNYREIRAPFSGVVTKRYISPGTLVNSGQVILNIVQIDKVRLQANVAETDLGRIHPGAEVTAQTLKEPRRILHARVTSISPLADQTSRTAVVEAIIDNPGHYLVPGDFISMDIQTAAKSDAISVPVTALATKDGHDAVWVACAVKGSGKMSYFCTMHPEVVSDKPGFCPKCNMKLEPKRIGEGKTAHLVPVILGGSGGDRVEVLSGLKEGDEVITAGNKYLKEGDYVYPTKWNNNGPSELPPSPGNASQMKMPGHGGSHNMPGMNMPESSQAHQDSMPGMDMSSKHDSMPMQAKKNSSHDHCDKIAQKTHVNHPGVKTKAGKYTCPMHPEFITNNPNALCPKCNMKVVPVKK